MVQDMKLLFTSIWLSNLLHHFLFFWSSLISNLQVCLFNCNWKYTITIPILMQFWNCLVFKTFLSNIPHTYKFHFSGERILSNISDVAKNVEVMAFLGMMMFAGIYYLHFQYYISDFDIIAGKLSWEIHCSQAFSTLPLDQRNDIPMLSIFGTFWSGPCTTTASELQLNVNCGLNKINCIIELGFARSQQ